MSSVCNKVGHVITVTRPILVRRGHKLFRMVLKYRILAFAGGLTMMYGAWCLSDNCPTNLSHEFWECFIVWPIHAFGLIPVLKPLEVVWSLMQVSEDVAEVAEETVGF